jgi:hypothetical protein
MTFKERDLISDLQVKLRRIREGKPLEDCLGLYIFATIRCFLEQNALKDKYPVISLFSDWMVHPKLDRNKIGKKVVENIVGVLRNNGIPFEQKSQEINRKIGYIVLQKELSDFFQCHGLDLLMLEGDNWKFTFGQIARLITSKPIDLKDHELAHFKAGEIPEVKYDGFPVFWLYGEPGKNINSYTACVETGKIFSKDLIEGQASNGTVVFKAGLYWDAV